MPGAQGLDPSTLPSRSPAPLEQRRMADLVHGAVIDELHVHKTANLVEHEQRERLRRLFTRPAGAA